MADFSIPPNPAFQPQERGSFEAPPTTGNKRKTENKGNIWSTVAVLLIAPLVALFLTAFVFQSYQVDGPSMETTLFHNDRLFVWKVSKAWSRITGHAYIPKRGDVIIFTERANVGFSQSDGKQLIKRVIGLPGERVVVKNNIATVYNKEHPQGFQPDKTLPYGDVITETAGNKEWVIPKDEVFVMGDNRPNSLDSRSFGPVAAKDIVGKLVMRVWPLNEAKRF